MIVLASQFFCRTSDGIQLKVRTRRTWRNRFTGVIAPVALLVVAALPAYAQSGSDFTKGIDPLFQGVLTRPANVNNDVQYAETASQTGGLESAISTYEQLLFYNPKLSQTRYILGVLYFQLGSYATAHGYLQTAVQMADITPEFRQQAEELLELTDKKLQADQFYGIAQTGLRYQSNATQGMGPQTALASGQAFNPAFFAKPDWNWFGAFGLDYVHDFQTQDGTTFEVSFLGWGDAVPVYCGNPDISKFVPKECFVDATAFATPAEMVAWLARSPESEWTKVRDAGRAFLYDRAIEQFLPEACGEELLAPFLMLSKM